MPPSVARIVPVSETGLLTLEEAAEYLKIAPGTLKNWLYLQRIEHVRIASNRIRFRRAALDRFIAAHTIPAREG
jgi:excisionase family DNA binding protein